MYTQQRWMGHTTNSCVYTPGMTKQTVSVLHCLHCNEIEWDTAQTRRHYLKDTACRGMGPGVKLINSLDKIVVWIDVAWHHNKGYQARWWTVGLTFIWTWVQTLVTIASVSYSEKKRMKRRSALPRCPRITPLSQTEKVMVLRKQRDSMNAE